MSQSSPEIAAQRALVEYFAALFAAHESLSNSRVVDAWLEPTDDVQLADDRVTVAVSLGTTDADRVQSAWVQGDSVAKTQRYQLEDVRCAFTLGVWANSRALRDSVDDLISQWVNRPFWSTIDPVVSTTITHAITAEGLQWVTPASMTDIYPGVVLRFSDTENVRVLECRETRFLARLRNAHANGATAIEVKARREHIEHMLHLRCSEHFGVIARFVFEGSQRLDDAGAASRSEWRSIRNGVIWVPHIFEVTGPTQTQAVSVNKTWSLGDE